MTMIRKRVRGCGRIRDRGKMVVFKGRRSRDKIG